MVLSRHSKSAARSLETLRLYVRLKEEGHLRQLDSASGVLPFVPQVFGQSLTQFVQG